MCASTWPPIATTPQLCVRPRGSPLPPRRSLPLRPRGSPLLPRRSLVCVHAAAHCHHVRRSLVCVHAAAHCHHAAASHCVHAAAHCYHAAALYASTRPPTAITPHPCVQPTATTPQSRT
jgi:hypothetical protein